MTWEGAPSDATAAFDDELASLRAEGSAFLVVGDVEAEVHEAVCDRWLGAADAGRYRLVVRAGRRPDAPAHDAAVVALDADVRSTAARAPDAARVATSLSELGVAAVDELAAMEPTDPGAVRVCVDDATALRCAADDEALFRFLHVLSARVAAVRGLVHVHVPTPPDDELVTLLEPLVDGTVTLRGGGGRVRQRWPLHDADAGTGWFPVE